MSTYTKFEDLADGLNVPQELKDRLLQPRTCDKMDSLAENITRMKYLDSYILAGRILTFSILQKSAKSVSEYIECIGHLLGDKYREFYISHADEIDKLLEETEEYNYKNFDLVSASAVRSYLLKTFLNRVPIENYLWLCLRQAVQLYHDEGFAEVKRCYYELLNKNYVHASPICFNSCLKNNQLGSCFLMEVGDNLESLLYGGCADGGIISKNMGAVGVAVGSVRHSEIKGGGKTSGIIPFGAIYDSTYKCVNQATKRPGAVNMTLPIWHIDVFEFVASRDATSDNLKFDNANITVFTCGLFMDRVAKDQDWTLFCPGKGKMMFNGKMTNIYGLYNKEFEDFYPALEAEAKRRKEEYDIMFDKYEASELDLAGTTDGRSALYKMQRDIEKKHKRLIEFKTVKARKLYRWICEMNMKSSMPYICDGDSVNYKNNLKNLKKPTNCLNLCLEIIEPATPETYASCNLGHVNLKKFVKGKYDPSLAASYDFEGLGKATRSLVRNISKAIEHNHYFLGGKIKKENLQNRPLGIGVSGMAEMFALLDVPYDSPEAERMNKAAFACMYYNGLVESNRLAKIKGEYDSFRTGSFEAFVDGEWKTFEGSPLANGMFQFDMWKQEQAYLESIGRLNKTIAKDEDLVEMEPVEWGQAGSWESLRATIMDTGVHNSMILAIMPTATSAQVLRNCESTEAHQTLIYSRKLLRGNYTLFSEPFAREMETLGIWDRKFYSFVMCCNGSIKYLKEFLTKYRKENENYQKLLDQPELLDHVIKKHRGMYDISQKTCVRYARQRGIYVDQSQSLNIYLAEPNMRTLQTIHNITHASHLKTNMYYLRSNPGVTTDQITIDTDIKMFASELTGSKSKKDEAAVCRLVNGVAECVACQ